MTIKVGDFIAALNSHVRGTCPFSVPLVVTQVSAKRVTAHPVCPEGRDPATWSSSSRHLQPSEVIRVFPNEATGREACAAAYEQYRAHMDEVRNLERQNSVKIYEILRGVES